ncbi:MAG: DUF2029 domain-containing protein [Candidatus Dormibacteraeota bacterium]|nr:DUF2029 domain-containing protein [Candidatus Dormibacteraeota bacterium]MBV9525003.1 DUF2029 domain-containing protein [Candidatus Dormibacteraeota bacterium]
MLTDGRARAIAAVAVAILLAYALVWARVPALDIGRSDFTSTYVGATLLRDGQRDHLYDESAQSPLHSRLIAPDTEGNLPFVDAPLAAALAAPVTLLGLDAAYRVWGLLQLALLIGAVVVAARAAPWPVGAGRGTRVAACAMALAGAGTLVGLLQAQWGGVSAFGLALAYHEWRHGREARGAAVLVAAAAVAKPHLALGLLAFMLGWGRRRMILGALAAALATGAATLAVAGPAGLAHFVTFAVQSNTRWELRTFVSFVGIPGSFLGNSGAAQVAGAVGSVVALAGAVYLGRVVRHRRERLEPALAGAAVLSILAAPHAGIHDLVLLAPAMVWSVAWAWPAGAADAETRRTLVVTALWAGVTLSAFVSLGDNAATPPGQLVPWVLVVAAVLAIRAARAARPAGHPLTSRRDAAAVGAMAHDVRGHGRLGGAGLFSLQRRG